MRYNLLPFTDTNSVICKIIVGADAHIRPRVDVGIDPYEKRRKIYYESNWGAMGALPVADEAT